ncbi:MAG TPA: hypothetical protein VFX16_33940 [Pseudonocardiaceae bacterium]|nr:hypothetical protein [Pseudonocardiaceae bacterium]
MADDHDVTDHGSRLRHENVNGRRYWVLEDGAGILEVADSKEVLAEDHPEANIDPKDSDD